MSNRTYICLECRTAKRAPAAYGINTEFRCIQCHQPLFELPWRWRIPKRTDDSEWQNLRQMVCEIQHEWKPVQHNRGQVLLDKIDRKIDTISRQKDTDSKAAKLKYYRWQRREIQKKHT